MQFQTSFFLLLVGLLSASQVDAVPVSSKRSVTFPLYRHEHRRDVHPLINLQQNVNRGLRRLARMTGRAAPSDEELTLMLHKRIVSVEGEEGLAKRYYHHGHGKKKNQSGEVALQACTEEKSNAAEDQTRVVTDGNTPTTANSLPLDIDGPDIAYLAKVQMGTPPRDFLILMDSGSADLWVGSENCKSVDGGGCGNHQFLGEKSSSTFKDSKQPFGVVYGSGAVNGTIIQDDLVMGDLKLIGHTFGVADSETDDFANNRVPFDGLMGLAQSTLSEQKTLTPIEALAKQGLVSEAITSYKISRLADQKNDGEITFGALDDTKFDPQTLLTIDNVSKFGFWEAPLDAATVDGKDAGLKGRTAILDTGTTLIIAPQGDAEAVHQLIDGSKSDGQGGFSIPCQSNASVALTFGGTQFDIDFRDLAIQQLNPNDPGGDCISGISGGNIGGETQWLVGDVFLKNAYFSTNVDKNTVSLAKLV